MERRYSNTQQALSQPSSSEHDPTGELKLADQSLSQFIRQIIPSSQEEDLSYDSVRNFIEVAFETDFRPQDDQIDFIKKRLKSRQYKNSGKVLDKIKLSKYGQFVTKSSQAKIENLDSGRT